MRGKWIQLIAAVSGLACLLWLVGLGWSLYEYLRVPANPPAIASKSVETGSKTKKDDRFNIIAIGDSLTRGTGDSTGKGYVGNVKDSLEEKTDRKIYLSNLGIKGQRSNQLLQQVNQPEVQRQLKDADVIMMTIGGNDLFQSGQTLVDLNLNNVKTLQNQYLKNVNSILSTMRAVNKDATIFFIGLYNPFIKMDNASQTSSIVREWNFKSAELSAKYPKTVFVPTFDIFELKVDDYLYSDHFHPNAEGYKLVADRVASLITW